MHAITLFLVALLPSSFAFAQADYAREKRWADEIAPAIVVGDPVYLEAAGRKFLAIYTPNPKPRAGVVVVHGMGLHPDWGLVNSLRTGLAEQGYTTLSVQMPVLAADADAGQYAELYPAAADRLQAAIALLRARGMSRTAIVAHSLGARMADFFLNRSTNPGVDAWVAIGIPGDYITPQAFKQPLLDIYGERDFPDLLENAEKRASALRKLRGAAQIRIAEADHFFNGREAELVRHIKLFLDRALK